MSSNLNDLFLAIDSNIEKMQELEEALDNVHSETFNIFLKDIREVFYRVRDHKRKFTIDAILDHLEMADRAISYIRGAEPIYMRYINTYGIGRKYNYDVSLKNYCEDAIETLQILKFNYKNDLYIATGEKFYFVPAKYYDVYNIDNGLEYYRENYSIYQVHTLLGPAYTNIVDAFKNVSDKGAVYVFNKNFEFCEIIFNRLDISEGYDYINKYLTDQQIQDIQNSTSYKSLAMASKLNTDDNFTTHIRPTLKDIPYSKSKISDYTVLTVDDSFLNLSVDIIKSERSLKRKYKFNKYEVGGKIIKENPNWVDPLQRGNR